ncbi:hypothetical protein SAMN02745824_1541 [Parasphingorhabdus marina DSM 22363]|uniref:Uncharacterized protein n=1 Tax=Parasphingorhabdus marina DSM 22363 TaxID=1123272 RepID=A0A1N6D4L4_9SPHN|nr:hypothetical protein [Parasphingorhabdus marina]SIN65742.1 hypothetical protein SAMN02745824_1541 [Parasphingorhabdus marina DSM 22363]
MHNIKNPFNDVYMAETIPAQEFVNIFSPELLKESSTHQLFQPGSVILIGLQGTGKSALLNLLKPEILSAYLESDEPWPLPEHCSKFISANIVLRSSGALDFGQRKIERTDDLSVTGLYFADFLNYWIVDDLLSNLALLGSSKGEQLSRRLGLAIDKGRLDEFSRILAKDLSWFGGLSSVSDFDGLRRAIKSRIYAYESFLNFNSDSLPTEIVRSKTKPGEPIGSTYDALREVGILPPEVPLFVTIDQFEDLMDLEKDKNGGFQPVFRSIVMRMLGSRDGRVSYRVGARPYSLTTGLQGFGNNAFTEEMREYRIVDIGDLLTNRESKRSHFPRFCDDVLYRRLKASGFKVSQRTRYTRYMFGGRVSPESKLERFTKKRSREKAISTDPVIPKNLRATLVNMARQDPLSAKLGEAWLRQNLEKLEISSGLLQSQPWDQKPKQWWKKERKQLAMLQVFSATRQRMVWCGADDVIAVCANNILTFLSVCQFIWAEYLRSAEVEEFSVPKEIKPSIQAMGIMSASEYWFRKVKAEPKGGDDRHRFVNVVGSFFRDKLRDDKRMSYPGANGFSLSVNVLEEHQSVDEFLDSCVAFGVLEKARHTPKSKSRGQSMKWYLSSILTPYFQIPTPHTKEPFYANIKDVKRWLHRAKVVSISRELPSHGIKKANQSNSSQIELDFLDDTEDD